MGVKTTKIIQSFEDNFVSLWLNNFWNYEESNRS